MRRNFGESLRKGWKLATLGSALLLAAIIPAPHHSPAAGQIFSVMASDFATPLLSSPRGIQLLNTQLGFTAWFAGYDQIHSLVAVGSTRELALVTRYSGDIHALLGSDFILRAKPGSLDHPVVVSEDFWRRMLGGSPDVIGQLLEASGERFAIAGVIGGGSAFLSETEVWIPLSSRGVFGTLTALRVVGQLQPNTNWTAGEKQLERLIATDTVQEQVSEAGRVHLLPIDRGLVIYRARTPEIVSVRQPLTPLSRVKLTSFNG